MGYPHFSNDCAEFHGLVLDGAAAKVMNEILTAREAAHKKHGNNSIESVPAGDRRWLPILGEEFGEVCETLTYDKNSGDLRSELIDVAVVALAWIDAIDKAEIEVLE